MEDGCHPSFGFFSIAKMAVFFQPAKIESKHPPKGPSTKTRSKRFQSSDFLQIQFSISADPDFGIATDLQNWYSLMSIRQNYTFDMLASIWHEIISWYLRISQYLRNMITRLFCTNMKIKTKTIYWSSFVNHGQIVSNSVKCQTSNVKWHIEIIDIMLYFSYYTYT